MSEEIEEDDVVTEAERLKYEIEKYAGPTVSTLQVVPEASALKASGAALLLQANRPRDAATQFRAALSLLRTAYERSPGADWTRARLDPLSLALCLNLSLAYLRDGDPRGALFFARRALQISGRRSAKAHYRRAMALAALGDASSAAAALRKAAEIAPSDAGIRRELARVAAAADAARRAERRVFASMLGGVTTEEELRRDADARERARAQAEQTRKLVEKTVRPLPSAASAATTEAAAAPAPPLMRQVEEIERAIDETENELRQLLMGQVREERFADVEAIDEDLDAWSDALPRMTLQERIQLARDLLETRKLLEKSCTISENHRIPETVARLDQQHMDALRELKQMAEEDGNEAALERLARAKEKHERLVRRFDFDRALQRVISMAYSSAAGADITKPGGNFQQTLQRMEELDNGGF